MSEQNKEIPVLRRISQKIKTGVERIINPPVLPDKKREPDKEKRTVPVRKTKFLDRWN